MLEIDDVIYLQQKYLKEIIITFPLISHIQIHTCYNITVASHWEIKDRINEDYHIVFVKGGCGYYTIEGIKVPLQKGRIIFLSSGVLHSSVQQPDNPPVIIPVRFGIYNNVTLKPQYFSFPPFSISFIPKLIQEFEDIFEKLSKYYNNKDIPFNDSLCGTTLTEILFKIYIELFESKNKKIDFRIEKVKHYIDNNPLSRLTINELADISGLSIKYCSILFKSQYGISPKQYTILMRMRYARFLIEETNQSIKQVSLTLGFPDQYSFSKQFKKFIGCSPSTLQH